MQQIGSLILKDTGPCQLLLEKTEKHLSHLANLIDKPFKNNSAQFRNEYQELEDDMALFTKTKRENRKQLFAVTERDLDDEQLTQLMGK